jgi:hypothetical protein
MKKIILSGLVLMFVGVVGCGDIPLFKKKESQAPAASGAALSGVYEVRGTNPGGSGNYAGTAMVTKLEGETHKIDWSVGTAYTGTGQRSGNTLTVEWGDGKTAIGTVKYNIESDGRLTGVWYTKNNPDNLGSEILIPRR